MELSEAAYTSPSGKRQTFLYDSVSRETALKSAVFTFSEFDGAQVQSLGLGARTFPLTCLFSGVDCAKKADAFESLLFERGAGTLEHPLYGKVRVVPTGTVKRSDNLVSGIGESSVEITFTESNDEEENPRAEIVSEQLVESFVDDFEEAAVKEAERICDVSDADAKAAFQRNVLKKSNLICNNVEKIITKEPDDVKKKTLLQRLSQYKTALSSALGKATNFVGNSTRLLIRIARLPSRVTVDILTKIQGYSDMADAILRNFLSDPFGAGNVLNQLEITALSLGCLSAGLSEGLAADALSSAATGKNRGVIRSRADVLAASDGVSLLFEKYVEFLDEYCERQVAVDSGETYEAALYAASYARRAVLDSSFDLPSCRQITLDRERNMLELIVELYGADGFSRLDEFILDNALTADELSVIPKGREIVYYE